MKVYNASAGGAFRLFISNNQTDVFIIDYDTALTERHEFNHFYFISTVYGNGKTFF